MAYSLPSADRVGYRVFRSRVILKAFKDSLPVLFGYLPLGGVYGVLFSKLGYHWAYSGLTSLFVFAGAAQYLSIALLSAHAPLFQLFLSALIINIRHVFYGFSFLNRYGELRWQDFYKICTLTDETYSLLTSSKPKDKIRDDKYTFAVSFFNHMYWVLGSMIGAYFGDLVNVDTKGLSFVLTALFVVLAPTRGGNRRFERTADAKSLIRTERAIDLAVFVGLALRRVDSRWQLDDAQPIF